MTSTSINGLLAEASEKDLRLHVAAQLVDRSEQTERQEIVNAAFQVSRILDREAQR